MNSNARSAEIDWKRVKHLLKLGIFAALMVSAPGNRHISYFLFRGGNCPDQSVRKRTHTASEMVFHIQHPVWSGMDSYHETDR